MFATLFSLFRLRKSNPAQAPSAPAVSPAASNSPSLTERRRLPRRGGQPIEVFLRDDSAPEMAARAWVRNRSTGGLGLSVAQPVAEGAILHVRVTTAPDSVPWVAVRVKGCRPFVDRWALNCQFVSPPPPEVMLLFR
jgi:hypothetical protein